MSAGDHSLPKYVPPQTNVEKQQGHSMLSVKNKSGQVLPVVPTVTVKRVCVQCTHVVIYRQNGIESTMEIQIEKIRK